MSRGRRYYDFGFEPDESPYHFAVEIDETGLATVVERFEWEQGEFPDAPPPALKAVLDGARWSALASRVADTFNERLRADKRPAAEWKPRVTRLAPHFGKELVLLIWAAEEATITDIQGNILGNWLGLAPEERWWLYTTINATSNHPLYDKNRGWRRAIKIAFSENPVEAPAALDREIPTPPTPKRRQRARKGEKVVQEQLPLE